MGTQINGFSELKENLGQHLGYSDWHRVTQERINSFADATDDHQWIHLDEKAAAEGPFGTTIAHGYLTLSLIPSLLPEVLNVTNVGMAVNYGANRIRFPSPVPSGSRIRLGATITKIEELEAAVQITLEATIETEGNSKPSLSAQLLFRYYK